MDSEQLQSTMPYDQMTATQRADEIVKLVSQLEQYVRSTDDLDLDVVVGSLDLIGDVAARQRDWTVSLELDHTSDRDSDRDSDAAIIAHDAEEMRIDDASARRMLGMDTDRDSGSDASVPAHFKLDEQDENQTITFDAEPYLAQADDETIRALVREDWSCSYAADHVAYWMQERDAQIRTALEYAGQIHARNPDLGGFEVWIDPRAAVRWLATNRPTLAQALDLLG